MGRTLAIDIETYSDVDLISCGVYKYSSWCLYYAGVKN